MGLRCIIGHDYGDPDRAEEREENGDELVVTVREYVECRRCGHRKTLSENTEVRTNDAPAPRDVQPSDEPGTGSDPEAGSGAEGVASANASEPLSGDGTSHPSIGAEASDGTAADDAEAGVTADDGATDDGSSGGDVDDAEYDDVTAAKDDGVILEDGTEDAGRDHGEWPEADESGGAPEPDERAEWPGPDGDDGGEADTAPEGDHGGWPTTDADDEGFDAEPSSGEPAEDVEFGGGLAPEAASDDTEPRSGTTETASGIARADPGPEPTTRKRPAAPDAVFVCPRCDYTAPTRESSLRPGDICPECGKGYLTEREE